MTISITHSTVATLPDEPGAEVNKDQWNDEHVVTGLAAVAETGAFADLVSHPTTLADYGITDGATDAELAAAIAAHEAAGNPHPDYLTQAEGDAAYAAISHTHAQADVTNLVSDLAGKQETLVSGTNIKTINGASVLGSGDLVVSGTGDGLGTDGDKGDITVGGTGTTLTIDANAVVTSKILDANVTLAKLADLAEARVIGRAAGAGTGVPTALTAAQLITILGSSATPISQVAIKTVEASGDYTPTAGMKYCIGILTGSGGGGGGADSSTTTNDIGVGGGGGAGSTRIGFFTAAQIGASKAVVLNAGGTAGSATNGTTGGTPSDNTFGTTLLVAPGGLGGVGSGAATEALNAQLGGAGGGAGSGGVFGVEGGAGGSAIALTNDATTGDGSIGIGGMGGSSMWGGGGRGGAVFSTTVGVSATSAGTAGKAHGSGGGGAVCSDTQAGADGGAGKIGIFVAIEFI